MDEVLKDRVYPTREDLKETGTSLFSFWSGQEKAVDWRWILALVLFAFLIRIPLLLFPEVIHNDGAQYIHHARQLLSGNWNIGQGKTHIFYPLLIALAHFISPNDEIAGILVSVVFGALLVVPVFLLGRSLVDDRVGMIAGLLASVHPSLYIASGSVLTESVYYFLFTTSVLVGWKAFDKGRWTDVFLFGLFATLSYLTRVEAIGFLFIFGVWVCLIHPPDGKRRWEKRITMLLLAACSFLLVASPYLVQIRKETGKWQFTKKISISAGSFSDEGGEPSVEKIWQTKRITLSAFVKSPLTVAKRMAVGFLESLYRFQQAYTPLLFVFLILGFVLSRRTPTPIKINLYLLTYFVYLLAFIFPFFRVDRRYTSHVIPLCLPWAAFGFLETVTWVRKRFAAWKFRERLPAVSLLVILVLLFVQGRVIHSREHRFIQRDAGYWMRDHLPQGVKVMSSMPQETFYADRPWIRIPKGSYEEILKTARSIGVRYLVTDERLEEDSPHFLEKIRGDDLIQVIDFKQKGRRMVVFEIVYPKGN